MSVRSLVAPPPVVGSSFAHGSSAAAGRGPTAIASRTPHRAEPNAPRGEAKRARARALHKIANQRGRRWGRARACARGATKSQATTHLLQAGAPLPVLANFGHADTRITERHYAHLVPSHVAQVIRAALPKLGIVERSPVAPMISANPPARLRRA